MSTAADPLLDTVPFTTLARVKVTVTLTASRPKSTRQILRVALSDLVYKRRRTQLGYSSSVRNTKQLLYNGIQGKFIGNLSGYLNENSIIIF